MSPQANESDHFHGKSGKQIDPIPAALLSGKITNTDAELIKLYVSERVSSTNLKKVGALKLTRILVTMRQYTGEYRGATLIDFYSVIDAIKTEDSKRGRPFKQQTQREYIIRMKSFYQWLVENGESSIPLNKIVSVKPPRNPLPIISTNELLSRDEIKAILSVCGNSRNRAMFSMLYEGGFRIGEVATMKWGALRFDSSGVVANVLYKTTKPRYVRLIMSKEALAKWKSDYPGDPLAEAYVFLNNRGEMMSYPAIVRTLDRLLEKANILKKVNLHLFRHSRITHLIQDGVSESVIKLMMWGTINSQSFAVYAHLSGVDVDREMCKLYNIDPTALEKPEPALAPKICPHCNEICGPTSRFCSSCGHILNKEDITTDEELQKWLFENKSYLSAYLNKMDSFHDLGSV